MRVLLLAIFLVHHSNAASQDNSRASGGDATGQSSSQSNALKAPDKYKLTCSDTSSVLGDIMNNNEEVADIFSDFKERYEEDQSQYLHKKVELSK